MNQRPPTIQSFPWAASIDAIKASEGFSAYADYYQHLLKNLPINSPETRAKYANVIQKRFFPDRTLNGIAATVWRSYHNENFLIEIMRVIAIEAESAVASFLITHVLPKLPGSGLDTQLVREFVVWTYGEFKEDSYKRLLQSCKDMGFLSRIDKDWVIQSITTPVNGFIILLHDRLAPTPRIVRLREILEKDWWHYLGLRDESEVREILRRAESAGLIARYSKVDELEQVTTRYSRDEYMQRALRL